MVPREVLVILLHIVVGDYWENNMLKEKLLYIFVKVLIIILAVLALWGLFDKKIADGVAIFLIDGLWIMAFNVAHTILKSLRSRLVHQKITLCKISIWSGMICVLLNSAANIMRNINASEIYMIAAYILAALSIIFAGTATWILYKAYMQK